MAHTLAEAIFGGIKVDNCLLMMKDMVGDERVFGGTGFRFC